MSVSKEIRIRRATPEDGYLIAALYREAYTPLSGGDARENYPFPQFLNGDWVADAVARPGICWIVAQANGQVVGSAGALRNIGSALDCVAEVYGIVVNQQFRGRRIGSGLLAELCHELGDDPQFVLCESRTAIAAGWRVARNCGFLPLGFEPFAHATPAGSEAMLMTGRIAPIAMIQRAKPSLTVACRPLAKGILAELNCVLTEEVTSTAASSGMYAAFRGGDPTIQSPEKVAYESSISVIRDDRLGPHIAARLAPDGLHGTGIVGLRRLEGEDPDGRRYERQYYVARHGTKPVASLLVVLDRVDRRARVLEMQSIASKVQSEMLPFVFAALESASRHERLSVVVDVCADAVETQLILERLGCLPTIYYPGLVAKGNGRVDAIQYTRLFNAEFQESLAFSADLNWPQAQEVVGNVQHAWAH